MCTEDQKSKEEQMSTEEQMGSEDENSTDERATKYVNKLRCAYGDQPTEAPARRLREIRNKADDINAGYGGKHVWLVPNYTTDRRSAANFVDVFIQSKADPAKCDVAKGAGGKFRYVVPRIDTAPELLITKAALLRSASAVTTAPDGYAGISADINRDRGGDCLYVVWKGRKP